MRSVTRISLSCLAGFVLFASGAPSTPARAGSAPTRPVSPVSHPSPDTLTTSQWDAVNLGRAVDRWLKGDAQGAAALLETIDISVASPFEEADRAAFLLATIYLGAGDGDAFNRVAARATDGAGSPYRRWIRYAQLARAGSAVSATAAVPSELPGADVLGATLLVEAGRPEDAVRMLENSKPAESLASIHLYVTALARSAAGQDATRDWEALGARAPQSALESDLVATALLELAQARIATGGDADTPLSRVPATSRLYPRALHLRALVAADRGDHDTAYAILVKLLEDYPRYEMRRDVQLALGAMSLDEQHWHAALRYFESADDNWDDELQSLSRIEDPGHAASVWSVWERRERWNDEIRLAPEALLADMDNLATASLDLNGTPPLAPDDGLADRLWPRAAAGAAGASWDSTGVLARVGPTPQEWDALRVVQDDRRTTAAGIVRQDRVIADRRDEIARRIDYLGIGHGRAAASTVALDGAVAKLEGILAHLDASVARLDAVRDSALVQIATRTRDMVEGFEQDILFMQALKHFHVDGPERERPEHFPPGVPSPGDLLALEDSLAHETEVVLNDFAVRCPEVINRSFEERWKPRLLVDVRGMLGDVRIELARAQGIGASIDSTVAAFATDPVLMAATARRDSLAAAADSLARAEDATRRDIARAAADRGRDALAGQREAIDYQIADAAYEVTVQLTAEAATTEDSLSVAPSRARAIACLDTLLARYPDSATRGESRFRLADLLLMQARDDFHARMASFLQEEPSADALHNRALAPFVDYGPAIALYRQILDEDPDYPHTDAVLFNLGMILSDDGQPDAATFLTRLVTDYPDSPDAQEAWLRMGSDRFDAKDYAGCIPDFEQAASGDDPSFTAIALYKLGWAQFSQDRFRESADAFRRLMDHYAAHPDVAAKMDLRDEAEEYLVHSLARAGGADAFREYFGSLGERDYESRILLSLGHLMRSVSMYGEAAACDELWLSKYPDDPGALEAADRLVGTLRRWNKADAAREAKLEQAERFLPGSPWFEANTDPALRARGEAFAQSAYRENAAYHHQQARTTETPADWESALDNYEKYLSHWPDARDADRIHFLAGETASHVNRYARSVDHYTTAAKSDSTALAVEAMWQRVAVTDAWYRSSRPAGAAATRNGADSLATRLLTVAREFVNRFPGDERCPDVIWRGGNVAYAHGRYAEASMILTLMSDRYPTDPRAVTAVRMSGDARYRLGDYAEAGAAYEKALPLARAAGKDSLVTELETTIPLCYYKHAESIAAADSVHGEETAAPLFAHVARTWPHYEHTDLALYRAGLGFAAGQKYADAAGAWEQLLAGHPKSEYARDSAVQIAAVYEKSGNAQSAARAYEHFSELYPGDPDAPAALLKAADLLAAAGDEPGAEQVRTHFIERFPGEVQTVMDIRAARAKKDLASVTAGTVPLSSLVSAPKGARGAKSAAAASELAAYLELAAAHPEMASKPILAEVDYLKAEAAYPGYEAMRLTQPLPKSIEKKKAKMEELLGLYTRCSEHGVAEYTHASAYRIGQVLIEFGDALVASERPAGLEGDDLAAYDEVLDKQSWEFYDRGEDVWSEMLRQVGEAPDDPGGWVARARDALWPRLAQRFAYRPEVEYPLVTAKPPEKPEKKDASD